MSATLEQTCSLKSPQESPVEPRSLSNKGRRMLAEYIRLYQVTHGSEVTKSGLMQLRGCGERTALEILRWLNMAAMQRLSLQAFRMSPNLESADNGHT